MKTSLQELKHSILHSNEIHMTCKVVVISYLEALIEKEKQDLIDAHFEGQKECSNEFAMESDARLYFKETFQQ